MNDHYQLKTLKQLWIFKCIRSESTFFKKLFLQRFEGDASRIQIGSNTHKKRRFGNHRIYI